MTKTRRKLRLFSIVMILIIALGLTFQYIEFNDMLKSSKESNIKGYNENLMYRLSSVLENNKSHIELISNFIKTVEWTEEDAIDYFKSIVDDNDIVRSIYFGSPSGLLINSDDWIPPEDYKFKEREWYKNALKGDEVITSSLYEDALDGSLIVTLSKATYDNEKNLLGVVAADIKVEDITMAVETLTNEILDYSFLIDADGNILRNKDHLNLKTNNVKELENKSKEKYMEFRAEKSGVEVVSIGKNEAYLFYELMEATNWILVSSIPARSYLTSESSLVNMFIIAIILAISMYAMFSFIFSRYFIRPTMKFYEDIQKINPSAGVIYRMPYYREDPFQGSREVTNEIITKTENLMTEIETNMEEIIAQNKEVEESYNKLIQMEQELRYQNNKNKAVNEALPDALFIIDNEGKFLDIQYSTEEELYINKEDYIGNNVEDVFPLNKAKNIRSMIKNAIDNHLVEKFEYGLDGYVGIQKYEIRIARMNENQALAIARNVTKERKLEEELKNLSYRDQLTKLHNRRYFEKKVIELDTEENLPISIIMGDINGLKLINDSFGHDVGDELIKGVGQMMSKGCRAEDIVFRVSGDEFRMILPNTDKESAKHIINRMKDRSKETRLAAGQLEDLDLAVSFGVSTKEDMTTDINDVVKRAEENMYYHKLHEGQVMRLNTISSMMESMFKENPEMEKHTKLAMEYAEKLSIALNLPEDQVQTVKDTANYQDIGKITFTKDLLNKTDGFTEKEAEEVKKHPVVGYRILSTINSMLEVAKYVLYHCERYDGQGYPRGLKGKRIPLESKIVSLADTYAEILSEEGFEEEKTHRILERLRDKSGKELDPELVEIFIEKVLKKSEI